jgi:hypothetical protein
MKLVVYTLNSDGSIPEYIIDGGYFGVSNNNLSPQNIDLVGVATNSAPQIGFANEVELLTYAQLNDFVFTNPSTGETMLLENVVNFIWSKLG